MRMTVTAVSQGDFDQWVSDQLEPGDVDLESEGWGLFLDKGCSACHAIGGTDAEGGGLNPGPDLTHLASRATFAGATYDQNTENLSAWLRNPSDLKPMEPDSDRGMPNLGLNEDEIDTLVGFLQGLN
jgi:cytochrome c oxidase subunit 2